LKFKLIHPVDAFLCALWSSPFVEVLYVSSKGENCSIWSCVPDV